MEAARASERGAGGDLSHPQTGRHLEYGKLAAVDAEGRVLLALLEAPGASRLRLVVEDEGATYPVVVDPLLTAMADARLESDQFLLGARL